MNCCALQIEYLAYLYSRFNFSRILEDDLCRGPTISIFLDRVGVRMCKDAIEKSSIFRASSLAR